MIERFMDWLVKHVYTERFQFTHLVVNYSLLALALVLYVLGVVGTWGILAACVPGVVIFFLSYQAWAWKMYNDGENPLVKFINEMSNTIR